MNQDVGRTGRSRLPGAPTAAHVSPSTSHIPAHTVGVLAGLLLTVVFVAALVAGGGRPTAPVPGLADAGAVTGWSRPLFDLVGRLLAVLTVGQLAYAALLAPACTGPATGASRALRASTWSAAGWLAAEAGGLVLTASALYGVPVTRLSVQAVLALVAQLPAGRASLWVGALLATVVVGTRLARRAEEGSRHPVPGPAAALLLAALGAIVVPVVLSGHSAAADDHVPAVLALSVHVVAASLWVGGLAALLLHGRDPSEGVSAVSRFSALALACVVLLLVSGAVAAVLVAGRPSWSWAGEGWVRLLVVKAVLLGLLAAVGVWHRRHTLPALSTGRPRAFVRLGVVEVAVMTVTLALSVALAASPAPEPSMQASGTASPGPSSAVGNDDAPPAGTAPRDDAAGVSAAAAVRAEGLPPTTQAPVEDMSGHDHGELTVSVLVDEDRFHVAGAVRPGQRVTVYNRSDSAATITALDGSFDVDVPGRTFVTFEAPAQDGRYAFVSLAEGRAVDGFADTLLVRADP